MRVLICGGGVIGASIAYFLTCRGVKPIVVERTGVACAASGKSGGFLALDWCDGSPLEALARRSFALHASLPEKIDSDWGYRRLATYGGHADAQSGRRPGRKPRVDWVSDDVMVDRHLGSTDTTAQVHPGEFTAAMMRAAEAQGATLRPGQSDRHRARQRRVARPRRRGRRRDDRGRRRGGRHGPLVDPGRAVAATAAGVRTERAQSRLRHRNESAGGGTVPRIPGGERRGARA